MDLSISIQSVCSSHAAVNRSISGLKDEFIFGGHLTAMGAPMKILFVAALLNIQVVLPLLLIAYTATLIVYSFDYYGSIEKDRMTNPGRSSYFSNNAGSFPYRILTYIAVLLASLALFANVGLALVIISLMLSGILYTKAFKNFTRKIPAFKNIYTSAIWTSGIIFGLLSYHPRPIDAAIVLLFQFLLMRSLGNVIFCDMKDITSDAAEGLKTVPVLLGRERTFALLKALNMASFLPLVAGIWLKALPAYALSMISIALFTFFYLELAKTQRHGRMYYLMADVETLMWLPIMLVGGCISAI